MPTRQTSNDGRNRHSFRSTFLGCFSLRSTAGARSSTRSRLLATAAHGGVLRHVHVVVEPSFGSRGFGRPDAVALLEFNAQRRVAIFFEAKLGAYAEASKSPLGQTAKLVVLAACINGVLPYVDADLSRADQERQREEQRRLFYVGITRDAHTCHQWRYTSTRTSSLAYEHPLHPPDGHGSDPASESFSCGTRP
jgi:hypothetical protein